MSEGTQIHQKTINNAISAYLMLFISATFLLNKDNEYINNSFVKSHTKVAFLIHLSFLVTYVIFIRFAFLKDISIVNYSLSHILASSIFTLLFITLLYWIYKTSQSQMFKIWDIFSITKREKIIDIDNNQTLDEKDKLTLILSYIPFIGYFISGEYHTNTSIKSIVHLNLIVSIIIVLIYIFDYSNVSLLLSLFYIIFGVFSSINIITNETLVWINLSFIPNPEQKITLIKSYFKYLAHYFWKKDFVWINILQENQTEKRKKEEIFNAKILEDKKSVKFPKALIYIPIINLFTLKFLHSKQRFHIINGTIITLLFIIILLLSYFYIIPSTSIILLLFPITFGIWYITSRPAYKMPFIYEIYETFVKIKNIFKKSKADIKERQAEEHSETLIAKK